MESWRSCCSRMCVCTNSCRIMYQVSRLVPTLRQWRVLYPIFIAGSVPNGPLMCVFLSRRLQALSGVVQRHFWYSFISLTLRRRDKRAEVGMNNVASSFKAKTLTLHLSHSPAEILSKVTNAMNEQVDWLQPDQQCQSRASNKHKTPSLHIHDMPSQFRTTHAIKMSRTHSREK